MALYRKKNRDKWESDLVIMAKLTKIFRATFKAGVSLEGQKRIFARYLGSFDLRRLWREEHDREHGVLSMGLQDLHRGCTKAF